MLFVTSVVSTKVMNNEQIDDLCSHSLEDCRRSNHSVKLLKNSLKSRVSFLVLFIVLASSSKAFKTSSQRDTYLYMHFYLISSLFELKVQPPMIIA